MRRTLKKNTGFLTPVTLLANLGIALCLTAATTLLLEPACIGEAASVELGVGALVLISETEPEVFLSRPNMFQSALAGSPLACRGATAVRRSSLLLITITFSLTPCVLTFLPPLIADPTAKNDA